MLEWFIVVACAFPILFLLFRRVQETRFQRQLDGVQMSSPNNEGLFEIVDPPFWRFDRWVLWFRATTHIEMVLPDGLGKPRYKKLRMRPVKKPLSCPLCHRPYKRP